MSAVYNLTNPNTLLLTRLLKQKMKIKFTSFQSEVYFLNLFLKFDYSSHNVHISMIRIKTTACVSSNATYNAMKRTKPPLMCH